MVFFFWFNDLAFDVPVFNDTTLDVILNLDDSRWITNNTIRRWYNAGDDEIYSNNSKYRPTYAL